MSEEGATYDDGGLYEKRQRESKGVERKIQNLK